MAANNMELNPEVLTGAACINKIESEIVDDVYKIFFKALTLGQTKGGVNIESDGTGGVPATSLGPVNYPTHLINNLAMEAVADLQQHINKIIDIIAPQDLEKISNMQAKVSGAAESLVCRNSLGNAIGKKCLFQHWK